MTRLEHFTYICPVETKANVRRALAYAKRHHLDIKTIGFIGVSYDVVADLRWQYPQLNLLAIDELPETKGILPAVRQFFRSEESIFSERAKTEAFTWSILFSLHAEYLLQVESSLRLIVELIRLTTERQIWLLDPAGWLHSHTLYRFGDRTPIFFLALEEALKQSKRPFQLLRPFAHARLIFTVERLRQFLNTLCFILFTLINGILGMLQTLFIRGSKPTTLILFREAELVAPALGEKQHVVDYENIRFWNQKKWWMIVPEWLLKAWRICRPSPHRSAIGRLDPRLTISNWVQGYLYPFHWRDYALLFTWSRSRRAAYRLLDDLYWSRQTKKYPRLRRYSQLIIKSFRTEYLYAHLIATSLQRRLKPQTVVYPDGYSLFIRLMQWLSLKEHCKGIQVPHGYPNRYFPRYYYEAQSYLAPTELTVRHLTGYGLASHIKRVALLRELSVPPKPRPQTPVIGVIYTGIYTFWSFPNQHYELLTLSGQLIPALLAAFPQAQIILKSHPNGTSPAFFGSLKQQFAPFFATNQIQHIEQGWSTPAEYQQLDAAVSVWSYPSTPFIHFLKSGIPLIVVTPTRDPAVGIYEPLFTPLGEYPLIVPTIPVAVSKLREYLNNPQPVRRMLEEYGQRVLV